MRRSAAKLEPHYGRNVVAVQPAAGGSGETAQRVTVTLERLKSSHKGQAETVKARYVVGCDGAHSIVRTSIRRELRGDTRPSCLGK